MPVYLDAIPDVAPKIQRPDIRRWLYLLALIMVTGSVLVFWLWTGARAGGGFWFTALGLPFCLWGLMFSIRRIGYKCDQVWAAAWDRERAQLLQQETARGQRAAWVLDTDVITQLRSGPDILLDAVKSATAQLAVQIPRAGGTPLRHSRLEGFQEHQRVDDFGKAIITIACRLRPLLEKIPAGVPCWLMVDVDVADFSEADERILQMLVSQTGRQLRLLRHHGLTAFDLWLDEVWKTPAALIVVSAVVRAHPLADEGEAITYLLLLNRYHPDFPEAVRLHRPEPGGSDTLSKTLARALLWCHIAPEAVMGAWITGKRTTEGGEWSLACEENRLTFSMIEDNQDLDQAIGYTGITAPWLAIVLAAACVRQSGTQIVAVETGSDEIWVVGMTTGDNTGINQDLL